MRVLHDGARRLDTSAPERRDRGAGVARTCAPAHPPRRVHGHGRARPQSRQRARGDRLARHGRRSREQEPRVLDRRRQARVRAATAVPWSSPRWRCRCTRRSPSCARNCCRARRGSTPPSSWRSPTNTRARPSTRLSINGRCSKASTTATTSSSGIATLLAGKYAVMNFIPYNTVDGARFSTAVVGARGSDVAVSTPARHSREAAPLRGPGRRSGMRPTPRARGRALRSHADAELDEQAAPRIGVESPVLLVADIVYANRGDQRAAS